jgi:hypothetical protein
MINFTAGSARALLTARDALSLRERLNLDDLILRDRPDLTGPRKGNIFLDETRRRPLYFDGRFLAARDLTREQTYFLSRQAELGRAGGYGVVTGLEVLPGTSGTRIRIQSGHGITPNGEMVLVDQNLDLDLADVAAVQRLDVNFGMRRLPNPPVFQRSGLFILTLRAVEYTANPITSYPTSITGPRSVEDGDIVEATAVSLVPFSDDASQEELSRRRSRAARQIFVSGQTSGILAEEALPIAMLALNRGTVQWIDNFMVRREVGAEHGDVLGLGLSPRATREAYLLQYDDHIQDIARLRPGAGFAASEYLDALPPAGRMPAAAVNPDNFSQVFFPNEVDVELSFVPEDELRALLEDSLLLQPIDLTLRGEQLESTSVLVVAPVPRHMIRRLRESNLDQRVQLRQFFPGLLSKRRPLEMLEILNRPVGPGVPIGPIIPLPVPVDPVAAAWRQVLQQSQWIWYVRRRDLSYKEQIVGQPVVVASDDVVEEAALENHLREKDRLRAYRDLRSRATPRAVDVIAGLLNSPKLRESPTLTEAALKRLKALPTLDRRAVLEVAESFASPSFGDGVSTAEKEVPELQNRAVVRALDDSGLLAGVDRLGLAPIDTARRVEAVNSLVSLARSDPPADVKEARIEAAGAASDLLASPAARASTLASEAALDSLNHVRNLDLETARSTTETFRKPEFSAGLALLESASPALRDPQVVTELVSSGVMAELSTLGVFIQDPAVLKTAAEEVAKIALSEEADKTVAIRNVIAGTLKGR